MKSTLSHLIVALILCVSSVVAYSVWYASLSAKNSMVAGLERDIRFKTEAASRIFTTRTTLANVANSEAVVRSSFVQETGVVSFIDALEDRGKEQGAVVNVLSVSTEGAPEQLSLVLSLTVEGTFEAMMRTVGAIEHLPYALSVTALSITHNAKNAWRAELVLRAASLPAASGAMNAPVSLPPPLTLTTPHVSS